jgi:hypothetical protein
VTAPRKPVALSEGTWPQVWSGCIKDAAVQNCTPEWLLWKRITALEAERDEARNVCEQLSARTEAAELGEKVLTAERDEARKHPGADDSRVAAINDAVMDFVTRKDNPRLVCFHVPVIECEVLMFAVGEGLPKAIAYAQFIRTLERSAGIESDSSAVSERDALRAEVARVERERDGVRGLLDAAVVLGAERTIERDALRAEVEAWRSYDDGCEHGDLLDMSVQHLEEARRLRAQNEGGARGCGGD